MLKALRPRHIMVLDSVESGSRSRRMMIRPVVILLTVLSLMIGAAALTYLLLSDNAPASISKKQTMLRDENQNLRRDLAETKAEYAIKKEFAATLEVEIDKLRDEKIVIQQQLLHYENILEARKTKGIHIINGEFSWYQDDLITYKFVLVNGSDGSRRSKGSIEVVATDGKGHTHSFDALPYRMETHTFLEGLLKWREVWLPDRVVLTHISSKKKPGHRLEIVIQRGKK